ncbi:MAG TPA: hypothetical protein VGW34_01635 [Allosphingosinicella sp.]|nr:hypothetical protein [Allosphingosinicella sp.]
MPRFYFDVHDDCRCTDDEGLELPDAAAARAAATEAARELICDQVRAGRLNLRHRIEVEDGERRAVLTLPFGSALQIED